MDIRMRYLNMVNMLMFVLGIGLAFFVFSMTMDNASSPPDRGEQARPAVGSPHGGDHGAPIPSGG